MATLEQQIDRIDDQVDHALALVRSDREASNLLRTIVSEFQRTVRRTRDSLSGSTSSEVQEHLIELEQAAESAIIAAEVDKGASPQTRRAVLDVHETVGELKVDMI